MSFSHTIVIFYEHTLYLMVMTVRTLKVIAMNMKLNIA